MRRHRSIAVLFVLVALLALPARAALPGPGHVGGLPHHAPVMVAAVMDGAGHGHGLDGHHTGHGSADDAAAICPVHGAVPVPVESSDDRDDHPGASASCCSFACAVLALPVRPQGVLVEPPRGFGPAVIPAAGPGRVTTPPLRPPKA